MLLRLERIATRVFLIAVIAAAAFQEEEDDCCLPVRFAYGSCSMVDLHQPLWEKISQRSQGNKYSAFLFGGDNIYADVGRPPFQRLLYSMFPSLGQIKSGMRTSHIGATPDRLRQLYAMQNDVPGFKRFRDSGIPIEGVWDDHDYGINDGDRLYKYRNESKDIFLDFFRVPQDSYRRRRDGIYYSQVFEIDEHHEDGSNVACSCRALRVKLIMLDVRSFRDPWTDVEEDGVDPQILGEKQWMWLERQILPRDGDDEGDPEPYKEADLTILLSGFQILPVNPFMSSHHETWARVPREKRRLLHLLTRAQIRTGTATLLVSGDVHFSEINEEVCAIESSANDARPLRIVEFTSSGMTHAWQGEPLNWPRPYIVAVIFRYAFDVTNVIAKLFGINLHRSFADDDDEEEDLKFAGLNFGEIELVRSKASTRLLLRAIGLDGNVKFEKGYALDELASSRNITDDDIVVRCVPQHAEDVFRFDEMAPRIEMHAARFALFAIGILPIAWVSRLVLWGMRCAARCLRTKRKRD